MHVVILIFIQSLYCFRFYGGEVARVCLPIFSPFAVLIYFSLGAGSFRSHGLLLFLVLVEMSLAGVLLVAVDLAHTP